MVNVMASELWTSGILSTVSQQKLVQRYWENEHFEPFQLHDPISPKGPAYEAASKNQHDAKGTQAESLLQQNVPLQSAPHKVGHHVILHLKV